MKTETLQASLDAVELSAEPPKEILLFKAGWNDTKKGKFLFDDKAAELTMASVAKDGRDLLPFDIGHGMLSGTDDGRHAAAGWFKPVVRDGALLASDIEWTDKTHEAISNREYRFHSPAITYERLSRRVNGLVNVALTNVPATNKQTPIVLDSNSPEGTTPQSQTQPKDNMKLVALLGVTEDKIEDTVAALHADHVSLTSDFAALTAAKAEADIKLEAAAAELTAIKVAAGKAERDSRIEALSSEGKLAPAQHEFAASLSAEQFEAFAATLTAPVVGGKVQEKPAGKVESLTEVEKQVCAQLGVSEADFISQKELS